MALALDDAEVEQNVSKTTARSPARFSDICHSKRGFATATGIIVVCIDLSQVLGFASAITT